jgi:hypothetical protein
MTKIRLPLIDRIGYRRYREVFLYPLELIKQANLQSDSKRRYSKLYVDQLVYYLGGSLLHEDDESSLMWAGLDFEVDNTFFSEVFCSALEQAITIFYEALENYRAGKWVESRFETNYYLHSIDIMSGNAIIIDTEGQCGV